MQSILLRKQRLQYLSHQLQQSISLTLRTKQSSFVQVTKTLNAVSPLATLERGYAIISDMKTGNILRDASQINTGDKIKAKLYHGNIRCIVEEVEND